MMQRFLLLLISLSWDGLGGKAASHFKSPDDQRRLQVAARGKSGYYLKTLPTVVRPRMQATTTTTTTTTTSAEATTTLPTSTARLETTVQATTSGTTAAASHETTPRQVSQSSVLPLQLGTCTLCYNGTSFDAANMNDATTWVGDGVGHRTCAEAEQLVSTLAADSLSCTDAQIGGYAHCGCPLLPPLHSDVECNLCSSVRPSYDIDLTRELPRFPRPSPLGPVTCFDVLLLAHRSSSDTECGQHQKAAYACGCPGAAPPEPCSLCLSGSVLDDPGLEIVPGVTCQHVVDDLEMGLVEECGVAQATAGVYCGCEENLDPRARFDLPFSRDVCRICPDGELLPDTSAQLEDVYSVDGVDIPYFYSCGEAEWRINAFDMCNDESTTELASLCGCDLGDVETPDGDDPTTVVVPPATTGAPPEDPGSTQASEKPDPAIHTGCTLCEDGSEPPMGDELFPDIAMGFAMTCQEVHFALLDSDSIPRGSEECRTYQDMGATFCGCPTQPGQSLCEYPCPLEEIDHPFRFDYVQGETCASYWFGAKWAATNDACDYYTSRSNYCCTNNDLVNGCSFCYGGAAPTVEGLPTPASLATCQSFFADVPKLVSADDVTLCTYWQDWAYLNCGCPTITPRLPDQVECDLFPEGCSVDNIESSGVVLESLLYAKLSRPTTGTECLLAKQSIDVFICEKSRQADNPPELDEGYTLTVVVEPDYHPSNSAWVLLDGDTRVASSPAFRDGVTSTVNLVVPLGKVYTFVMMDAFGDGLDGGSYRVFGAFPRSDPVLLSDSTFENGFFETTTIDATLSATTLTTLATPVTTSVTTTLPPPETTTSSTTAADAIADDGVDERESASIGTDEKESASIGADDSSVIPRLGRTSVLWDGILLFGILVWGIAL